MAARLRDLYKAIKIFNIYDRYDDPITINQDFDKIVFYLDPKLVSQNDKNALSEIGIQEEDDTFILPN